MGVLHTKKIQAETEEFIKELLDNLPQKDELLNGKLNSNAKMLHKIFLPIHILKKYCPKSFLSPYLDIIMTNLIEAESLLILGFKNSGMGSLRGAFESALKFLYYEYHPIENMIHKKTDSRISVTNTDLRDFFYTFINLKEININLFSRDVIENLWVYLCKFIHSDIHEIKELTVVADISSILNYKDQEFNQIKKNILMVVKVIILVFFSVDNKWAINIEKLYYDAIFEVFQVEDKAELIRKLEIV